MTRPTLPKKPNWEPAQWVAVVGGLLALLAWLLAFVLFFAAIFIDKAGTEGNLAGAGVLVLVIAIVITIIAAVAADQVWA